MQARVVENVVERAIGIRAKMPSLLTGARQAYDPTHAVKNGKRYRYYVSRLLIIDTRPNFPVGLRILAAEIEQIVMNQIRRLLSEPESLFEIIYAQAASDRKRTSSCVRTSTPPIWLGHRRCGSESLSSPRSSGLR